MPVVVRKLSNTSVAISGINVTLAGKAAWRKVFDRIGRKLQERVAESFERQTVAGSRRLRPNTPEWDAYKRKKGYDPRRGHMTGRLQRALHSKQRLYSVSAITPQGTCIIRMREDWLRSRVPYAEYYEQAKVQGGAILAIAKRWVEIEGRLAIEFGEQVAAQMARAALGGAALNARLRMLADKAEREIAAKLEFARRAPFNEAVRPRPIRTTSGLTQKLMMQISKQAEKTAREANRMPTLEKRIEAAARRFGN